MKQRYALYCLFAHVKVQWYFVFERMPTASSASPFARFRAPTVFLCHRCVAKTRLCGGVIMTNAFLAIVRSWFHQND